MSFLDFILYSFSLYIMTTKIEGIDAHENSQLFSPLVREKETIVEHTSTNNSNRRNFSDAIVVTEKQISTNIHLADVHKHKQKK